MTEHERYMKEALKEAKKAYKLGEVPIGCVIVYEGKVIGRGYNRRNTDKTLWRMLRLRQSVRLAVLWETGVWKNVRCMLHWSHVRCVQEPLFRHVFQKW